jgi:hypothetical protein
MHLTLAVAFGLIAAGTIITLAGGNRTTVIILLVAGLLYTITFLWGNRRR